MNGEPLPLDHGFPARLVVPGWVGIASIKWLGELRVTRTEVDSPWNTLWYRMHGEGWDGAAAELGRLPVKSVLDERGRAGRRPRDPARGPRLGRRGRHRAGRGLAPTAVATWRSAELHGDNSRNAWTRWELAWTPATAGEHDVRVRATDTTGRTQPERAADNDDGYLFDAVLRHRVCVAEPAAR